MSVYCTCQACGEVLFEFYPKYYYNHPKEINTDCQQMQLQHLFTCRKAPFVNTKQNWDQWRQNSPAGPDETPRELVRRLTKAGHNPDEIYALVPVPPDRCWIAHDSIINNWYNEISQIVEGVKNENISKTL